MINFLSSSSAATPASFDSGEGKWKKKKEKADNKTCLILALCRRKLLDLLQIINHNRRLIQSKYYSLFITLFSFISLLRAILGYLIFFCFNFFHCYHQAYFLSGCSSSGNFRHFAVSKILTLFGLLTAAWAALKLVIVFLSLLLCCCLSLGRLPQNRCYFEDYFLMKNAEGGRERERELSKIVM